MEKRQLIRTSPEKIRNKRKKLTFSSAADSDIEEEDIENETAIGNSLISSEMSHISSKAEPVVGIIRSIKMSNFMCHNRLDVGLGTHVNFIVGRNGSGKSAIITALVVGLGGKATTTNRGSSIKNFVKSGKRSAWVEITLNNRGIDSYKPDIYGDEIKIKRKFSVDGPGSYAIYSAKDHHVSSRRDELQRILDRLNIQVDNPVSILNQDTSRNFLNSKSAADKFKFFMKATQLDQMSSDYETANKYKNETKAMIASKEEALKEMEKDVKIWENKFKNMSALTDLKTKKKFLKKELVWSVIAEKEKGLKPIMKVLSAEEAALPRFLQKVEESKYEQTEWETKRKECEQRLNECVQEIKELEPLRQQKKKEISELKEKILPLTNQLKSLEREKNSTSQDCKQCEIRIKELKNIAAHDHETERLERLDQIDKLKAQLDQDESKKKVLDNEVDKYRNAITKYNTEKSQLESDFNSKQVACKKIALTKQKLMAAKDDRLRRFGDWMPKVTHCISERQAQFHKQPRGPLGACFDLTDYRWAMAVENCLKGLMTAFVCHDFHDQKLLEEIFQKCSVPASFRPIIITSPFTDRVYNVSSNKVNTDDYPCMLDVIKSEDPVVLNTLIDEKRLENIILIACDTEASKVMMKRVPNKARECFTAEGNHIFAKPTFRYYANNVKNVQYLMSDVKEQIKHLEQEEKMVEEEKKKLQQQLNELRQSVMQNQAEEKKCASQLIKLSGSIRQLKFEISELQAVEDPNPVDVTTLEEEVENCKKKIAETESKKEQILAQKNTLDEQLNAVQKSYSQLEANIREKSDNGIPLKEEINQAQNEWQKVCNAVKHYSSKLREQQRKIQEEKEKVEKYKSELEEDRRQALENSQPIQTKRSPSSINNEIVHINQRIQQQEKQQGDDLSITTAYKEKTTAFEQTKKKVGQMQRYLAKLDEVMEKRDIAYQKMRKLIANRAKYYFLLQMSQRSFTGKMNFDFEKETLEILVTTNQELKKSGGHEAKDLKSLSGGERSFSTVCFILSLWEAMESPFRCLDEFDVFMDMVNRRISMDMMMATADMHKDQQFIFLTPQDMSSLKKIDNVKIFRMQDPERNQQALNALPN